MNMAQGILELACLILTRCHGLEDTSWWVIVAAKDGP